MILFTGGVCLSTCRDATPPRQGAPPARQTPLARRPPLQGDPPGKQTPPTRQTPLPPLASRPPPLCSACWEIRSTSMQYASYWNAVLVTRMHSSRMCTTHSSSCLLGGGLPQCMLGHSPRCGSGDHPPGVGLETPQVWAWRPSPSQTPQPPPGVGLVSLPQARPLNSPLGVGLETCKACWDTTSPHETCKACWDTTPPVNRITVVPARFIKK